MEETSTPEKSFWSKTQEELTVSEQLKMLALIPTVSVVAFVAPFFVIGKYAQFKERRALKKLNNEAEALAMSETNSDE